VYAREYNNTLAGISAGGAGGEEGEGEEEEEEE